MVIGGATYGFIFGHWRPATWEPTSKNAAKGRDFSGAIRFEGVNGQEQSRMSLKLFEGPDTCGEQHAQQLSLL